MSAPTEEALWRALERRTAMADWRYGVRTTGIYCRFDCGSKRPLRINVELFPSNQAAREKGYRACKRCRPDAGLDGVEDWLTRACAMLAEEGGLGTRELAAHLGLSPAHVTRTFKRRLGVTPQEYRRRCRSERAKRIVTAAGTVTEAIFEAGYSSSSRFYDGAATELGMAPSTARAGGRGETIHWCARPCTLGWVLVAWTTRGVSHVALGEGPDALRSALAERFARARLVEEPGHPWALAVAGLADGEPGPAARLPLDVRGTAFQERVWALLRAIPPGETRTYGELARALGTPTAARAVARACATNPLALLIPCHRVRRTDGALAGYRWGTERKRELLRREAAVEED